MKEYYVPTGFAETELIEKKSRFIGKIRIISSESEAQNYIRETKAQYYDARHTCWCYILHDGKISRYSDDGEPQGTAGIPMLDVFKSKGIENALCTVTRYFGGILLGTGGLVRAYSGCCANTLKAAGISVVRMQKQVLCECSYSAYERVKKIVTLYGGVIEQVEFEANVLISALIPEEHAEKYQTELTEMSAGRIFSMITGEKPSAIPYVPPEVL